MWVSQNGRIPDFQAGIRRLFGQRLSGTQVVVVVSYLTPGGPLSASLVVFMTRWTLLSFVVAWPSSNGTATSFWPAPRNPPTPMISVLILPDLSTRTSEIWPILLLFGS